MSKKTLTLVIMKLKKVLFTTVKVLPFLEDVDIDNILVKNL